MSALKPGIYKATVRGVPDQIVLIGTSTYGHTYSGTYNQDHIEDPSPLIVLDLDEQAGEVVASLHDAISMMSRSGPNHHRLTNLADQIIEQMKPARIPEPEPGEHVTAMLGKKPPRQRYQFLRIRTASEFQWVNLSNGHVYMWVTLEAPELVTS